MSVCCVAISFISQFHLRFHCFCNQKGGDMPFFSLRVNHICYFRWEMCNQPSPMLPFSSPPGISNSPLVIRHPAVVHQRPEPCSPRLHTVTSILSAPMAARPGSLLRRRHVRSEQAAPARRPQTAPVTRRRPVFLVDGGVTRLVLVGARRVSPRVQGRQGRLWLAAALGGDERVFFGVREIGSRVV